MPLSSTVDRARTTSSPSANARGGARRVLSARPRISKRCLRVLSVSECAYVATLKKHARRRVERAVARSLPVASNGQARMPVRLRVLTSALPDAFKEHLFHTLTNDDSDKARTMVESALRLPWGRHSLTPEQLEAEAAAEEAGALSGVSAEGCGGTGGAEEDEDEEEAASTVAETEDDEEDPLSLASVAVVERARRAVEGARCAMETAREALREDASRLAVEEDCDDAATEADADSDMEPEVLSKHADAEALSKEVARDAARPGAFLRRAAAIMDDEITGQPAAKREVLNMLARWHAGGGASHAIALEGPPGNGKTSFVKRALVAALRRPLHTICLGGASDASSLLGHGYTYEGARCGRLAEALVEAQTMDPILFFDEVDKLADTPRGDEILNVLVHLTDPVQNSALRDKYFSGLDIDFSKCIVVLCYNDARRVRSPVLLDRVKRIVMGTPDAATRLRITERHLLPEARHKSRCTLPMDEAALHRVMEAHATDGGMRGIARSLADVLGTALVCHLLGHQGVAFGDAPAAGAGGASMRARARAPLLRIDAGFVDAVLADQRKLASRTAPPAPPPGMYA